MRARDPADWISSSSAAAASSTTATRRRTCGRCSSRTSSGCPVIVYAISAGPLTTQTSRRAVREALNASPSTVITVRDRLGVSAARGRRRHAARSTSPPIPRSCSSRRNLPLDALEAEGVEFDRHLVGFSVREPGPAAPGHRSRRVLRAARERRGLHRRTLRRRRRVRPDGEDRRAAQPRASSRTCRTRSAPRSCGGATRRARSWTSWGASSSRSGMRLHFLIFAALRGTPFAALPYASKVTGLLEDLRWRRRRSATSIGQLIAEIDRSWDARNEIRATIERHRSSLRERAGQPNDLRLTNLRERGFATAADVQRPIAAAEDAVGARGGPLIIDRQPHGLGAEVGRCRTPTGRRSRRGRTGATSAVGPRSGGLDPG